MHRQGSTDPDSAQDPEKTILAAVARVLALPEVWKRFDAAGVGGFAHLILAGRWVEVERLSEDREVVRFVTEEQVTERILECQEAEEAVQ